MKNEPPELVLCEACGKPLSGKLSRRWKRCVRHNDLESIPNPAPQPKKGENYITTYKWNLNFSGTIYGRTKYVGDPDGTPLDGKEREDVAREGLEKGTYEVDDVFYTDVIKSEVHQPYATFDGEEFNVGEWLQERGWEPYREVVRPGEVERPSDEATLGAWEII